MAEKQPGAAKGKRPATTTIHLSAADITLLRRVAFARSLRDGGRASVSAVIAGLIDQHRAELEKEAKQA